MAHVDQAWLRAMREGNYEEAWTACERACAMRDPAQADDPTMPYHMRWVWDGRPFDGKNVNVRCYHGLGDTIQFARYLPVLRARAASVTLELQPRLVDLFAGWPGVDAIVPFDMARPLPRSECDLEIMELDFALRAPPAIAPPPYLKTAPAILPRRTVGICCRAGDWDSERNMPEDLLALELGGMSVLALDAGPSSLPVLNPDGCPFDMEVTASMVAACDLVVTVDTMIAHLAGAMGKPTWLMLKHEPDWRWSPSAGHSDWYPSIRLFVQPVPGDWESVAQLVGNALEARYRTPQRGVER